MTLQRFTIPLEDLKLALGSVVPFASTDDTRAHMQAIHIRVVPHEARSATLVVWATDGAGAALFELFVAKDCIDWTSERKAWTLSIPLAFANDVFRACKAVKDGHRHSETILTCTDDAFAFSIAGIERKRERVTVLAPPLDEVIPDYSRPQRVDWVDPEDGNEYSFDAIAFNPAYMTRLCKVAEFLGGKGAVLSIVHGHALAPILASGHDPRWCGVLMPMRHREFVRSFQVPRLTDRTVPAGHVDETAVFDAARFGTDDVPAAPAPVDIPADAAPVVDALPADAAPVDIPADVAARWAPADAAPAPVDAIDFGAWTADMSDRDRALLDQYGADL